MWRAVLLSALGLLAASPAYSQTPNANEQAVLKAYRALDNAQLRKTEPPWSG